MPTNIDFPVVLPEKPCASPILSGIADEAGASIERQIQAHRELSWPNIELRLLDGVNICSVDDAVFEKAAEKIEEVGLTVTGIASPIGNWSRPIDGDFSLDLADLRRAAPRMQRLGTRAIRSMSWLQGQSSDADWHKEAVRRYRELARVASDSGIVLLHENCTGWGGQGGRHMLRLLDEVASPHVRILFDIGNTVSHGYDAVEFYQLVKPHIAYVHLKDCRANPEGRHSDDYTMPGEGDAQLGEIVADLMASGYDGVYSIEPHVAAIVHRGGSADPGKMYSSYLEYARKAANLLRTTSPKLLAARV
jgi:sugar phosphate isomerase/epimerase